MRSILPFREIKCHVNSSVAHGIAVRESVWTEASDIDGGVVIIDTQPSEQQIHLFLEELKAEGFDVYSKAEADALQSESNSCQDKRTDTWREIYRRAIHARYNQIDFLTQEQVSEILADPNKARESQGLILRFGHSIE